jgi:hypothetical protein
VAEGRFLMVPGRRIGDRLAPRWPGAGRDIAIDLVPASWVAWRLLGNNHRELARSASVYGDVGACRAAIDELRQALAAGVADMHTELAAGCWTWVAVVGGNRLAVASRLYYRQREADHSCTVFAALAATTGPEWPAEAGRPCACDPLLPGLTVAPGYGDPDG